MRSAGASETRATRTTGPCASSFCSASDCRACALRSRAKSATVPAAAAMTATMLLAATRRVFRFDSGMRGLGGAAALQRELLVELVRAGRRPPQEGVDGGDDEEGDEGGDEQAADDGAPER